METSKRACSENDFRLFLLTLSNVSISYKAFPLVSYSPKVIRDQLFGSLRH